MSGRAFERKPSSIEIRFYCCGNDYGGTVTNISEYGMFIVTGGVSFPFDSKFEIAFPIEGEVFNIPVKVSRLSKSRDIYDGMAVEIIKPPEKYLTFLDNLKSSQ